MPAFQYEALNPRGEKFKGLIEAETIKQARQFIRNQGHVLLNVYLTHAKTEKQHFFSRFKKTISTKDLTLLTRQLATLLTAGMPLEEVLHAVAEQTEKHGTRSLIMSVRGKILGGYSLANALREFPRAFSNLYTATVAAGEKSGHLDVVLQRLADYTEQQAAVRQKIKNALIYPSIMLLVSFAIVGFLLEYVVPKMVAVYSNTGQALPAITQVLINFSNGLKNYGAYGILLLGIGGFYFLRHLKNNKNSRAKFQRLLLRLPLFGNATKTINTARFARTFAILSAAGVPVLEAMGIAAELITNIPIRLAVTEATSRIREGANIHLALKQTRFFPPMSIHLIASGETSGQLEPMLERAANNQDNDIKQLIDTTLTLFEPGMILFMGAIVLFIVLAILLPIFQLDQMTG